MAESTGGPRELFYSDSGALALVVFKTLTMHFLEKIERARGEKSDHLNCALPPYFFLIKNKKKGMVKTGGFIFVNGSFYTIKEIFFVSHKHYLNRSTLTLCTAAAESVPAMPVLDWQNVRLLSHIFLFSCSAI
jgi:hypothetical protein